MKPVKSIQAAVLLSLATASMFLAPLSCSSPAPSFRVAVCSFAEGEAGYERGDLVAYACDKVAAELGAEAELCKPGEAVPGVTAESAENANDGYRLVVSMGKITTEEIIASRRSGCDVPLVALDFPSAANMPGMEGITAVRYRVEEGAYLCGYLAGRITSGKDHPLANALPVVAFLGMKGDPMTAWYRAGFTSGVKAALPEGNVLVYALEDTGGSVKVRPLVEEAVKKGADIIFCAPGKFVGEVIKTAEENNILVIPAGGDLYESSPDHVLTSLILRDDNAVFKAVKMAMDGELAPGQYRWGIREGTWCLAPFRGHDLYIRRELKEELMREEEKVAGLEFSP